MNWNEIAEVRNTTEVDVDLLHFDIKNPRFTPDKRPDTDTDSAIISKLASTADLSELVQSISTSGYINIEPLIVVVRDDKLIVLEGNRRLAAIKCLRNPELAADARIAIPEMEKDKRASLENILVYRVNREEDARELIGFKHINGPQSWDAYAKAVYAARWLDSQEGLDNPLSLKDIAYRMGDKHATIHRMVTAYYVLQQAEQNEIYFIEERSKKSFSFSHLYTGLSYAEFTDYLGMSRPNREKNPSRSPISEVNYEKLRKLLLWLYGSKEDDVAPVVKSQAPDLRRLREVLGSQAATRELEIRGNLGDAVISATPKDIRFSNHLVGANAELQKAQETLDGFLPEEQPELHEIAKSALKRAQIIKMSLDAAMAELDSEVQED